MSFVGLSSTVHCCPVLGPLANSRHYRIGAILFNGADGGLLENGSRTNLWIV
jgi:hypothetical protein